jgi:polysaccharide deacetylase family protein (PEP-CTERM system associated)
VDVEGFAEGMAESFPIPGRFLDDTLSDREIETNVAEVLAEFRRLNWKATFFVLGRIAQRLPRMIKSIAEDGHELGSHSLYHKRIFNQSREQFRAELRRSKSAIENAAGKRVRGFRAPDFSIRRDCLWILDEIREAGFSYDSSLTPTDIHDVYGMSDVDPHIHRLANGLWEFPGGTFRFLGRTIPCGGGGYLRLYPIALSRMLIAKSAKAGQPAMIYIHPYELGSQIPAVRPMSVYRRFRHYYNTDNGFSRLQRILQGFKIGTAEQVLTQYGMGGD